jgi:alpha-glucosidase
MNWWRDAVFYQIYPRSFQDSNGDGIGDLAGIESRLDYLADLGVDALWISPFFKSPMKDFGYDVSDYVSVDPMFGTLEDFRRLLAAAHSRGMRVVVDLVLNHTSDEHPWFQEARTSTAAAKHDWYIWRPIDPHHPKRKPNNWISLFELRSAWYENPATREWYLATFTHSQPEVNWRNPDLRKAMYDVLRSWLDMGVDGFRLDVATGYFKDEEFRSNPFKPSLVPDLLQNHIFDRNRPEVHEVFREFRRITDSYGDRVLIAETHGQSAALAASCHGKADDELHMAFNFEFLTRPWGASSFRDSARRWYEALPPGAWPNFTLSNHDQKRHIHRYRKGAFTEARARAAAALLLTLRGTPFLYYGEEIGMGCIRMPHSALRDPLGIRTWPLSFGRDPERTPMQWDSSRQAGFTAGIPWLPINPDYPIRNVQAQDSDPESLLSFYRRLLALRREKPALRSGDIVFLGDDPDVLAYERGEAQESDSTSTQGERIVVVINFADSPRHIMLPASGKLLLSTRGEGKDTVEAGPHKLEGGEVMIVEREK